MIKWRFCLQDISQMEHEHAHIYIYIYIYIIVYIERYLYVLSTCRLCSNASFAESFAFYQVVGTSNRRLVS